MPIDLDALEEKVSAIGNAIRERLPPGAGFALLLFRETDSTYLSNVNREDMIRVLRETADIIEAAENHPGAQVH